MVSGAAQEEKNALGKQMCFLAGNVSFSEINANERFVKRGAAHLRQNKFAF
jgi:hypothetical protein